MEQYFVNIEISGAMRLVGFIESSEAGWQFRYDEKYLCAQDAAPISVSLPLQSDPFSAGHTECFFNGLLPEGFVRRTLDEWLHSGDYMTILGALGKECIGAVSITDAEYQIPDSGYKLLTDEELSALASEGATQAADIAVKTHLSLAGASGKVGVYYDEKSGSCYLPRGIYPSTHIIKQSHVRLTDIVINEQLCMQTAKKMGLDVPDTFIIVPSGSSGNISPLFAVRRFDREINGKTDCYNNLPVPKRLHQEDFAQALGIIPGAKYEPRGGEYMVKAFELLGRASADPIADQMKLWDAIVFDYLIGNTDNHLKNYSLLYKGNLRTKRLAPIYDVLSTCVYEGSTRNMAFSIGNQILIDDIKRNDFVIAAQKIGLSETFAMKYFDSLTDKFEASLLSSAKELAEKGFPSAEDIAEKVLHLGGYALL